MITTFIIEEVKSNIVVAYCPRMWLAKEYLKEYTPNEYRILVVRGQNFGEGWHDYYVTWDGSRFIKTKL
jgi:hypothetical protein